MMRRRLGALIAALTFGLAGGVAAAAPAAQAGTFTCGAKYFLQTATDERGYLSAQPSGDSVFADGNLRGWYEQFTVCRDSSWSPQFFVLKAEGMSAHLGGAAYIVPQGGYLRVRTGPLTGNHLFEWRGGGQPYYGLYHAESHRYVTADDNLVSLGGENLGWYEAFIRES